MSKITRHVGVMRNTGSRVFVVYRQLPLDPEYCLVVYVDSLPEQIRYRVEGITLGVGQSNVDLYAVFEKEHLERSNALMDLHNYQVLRKVKISDVEMHVSQNQKIPLQAVNDAIANSNTMASTEVSTHNPMNPNTPNFGEGAGIVGHLLAEAKKYQELADNAFNRAVELDPTIAPKEAVQESKSGLVLELPEGISQTKAIEMLKKLLKSRKESNE